MLSLRLVLDTNQIVSAVLKPNGLQRKAFRLALTPPAHLFTTEDVMAEYEIVLRRSELAIPKGDRLRFLQQIRNAARIVSVYRRLNICSDPDDNIFLECADAARADYLVTGNLRHFPKYWKGTKIITARELIDIVSMHVAD